MIYIRPWWVLHGRPYFQIDDRFLWNEHLLRWKSILVIPFQAGFVREADIFWMTEAQNSKILPIFVIDTEQRQFQFQATQNNPWLDFVGGSNRLYQGYYFLGTYAKAYSIWIEKETNFRSKAGG